MFVKQVYENMASVRYLLITWV